MWCTQRARFLSWLMTSHGMAPNFSPTFGGAGIRAYVEAARSDLLQPPLTVGSQEETPGDRPPGGSDVSEAATNRPRPLALVVVGPLLGPERGPINRRPGIGSLTWPYVGGATWT